MKAIVQGPREEAFRRLMRLLIEAERLSGDLGNTDVSLLLNMATVGVAAQWEGMTLETASDARLETVTKMRRRLAGGPRAGAAADPGTERFDDMSPTRPPAGGPSRAD